MQSVILTEYFQKQEVYALLVTEVMVGYNVSFPDTLSVKNVIMS